MPDLVKGALDPAVSARLRVAPANTAGVGTLTVNLALAGRLELPHHQPSRPDLDLRAPALFGGTLEDVVRTGEDCARGKLPDASAFCPAILTALDPSQAPAAQDVAQLCCPMPVAPRDGRDAARDDAADRMLRVASNLAPDIGALEAARYVETPDDLRRRTGAVNGCIYHVDHLPTRLGPLRPALGAGGYRTPLPGLYLGSAGCHPGGGVSGLSGKLCAAAVLADHTSSGGATWRPTSSPPSARGDGQPRVERALAVEGPRTL